MVKPIKPSARASRRMDAIADAFARIIARISKRPTPSGLKRAQKKIDELVESGAVMSKILASMRLTLDQLVKHLPHGTEDAVRTSPKVIRRLLGPLTRDPKIRKEMADAAVETAETLRSYASAEVDRIGVLLKKSVRESWTQERLSGEIRDLTSVTHDRARRTARDLSRRLHSRSTSIVARSRGLDQWRWIHSGNPNARPEHEARDGQVFSFADPPSELPGELPNCGCEMIVL
jgi:SPP1 gp7 family putative phage head morphogenesis protein